MAQYRLETLPCMTELHTSLSSRSLCGHVILTRTGVDPGFPVVGAWTQFRGRGLLMQVLFGENMCENKRIGPRSGACMRHICMQIRQ